MLRDIYNGLKDLLTPINGIMWVDWFSQQYNVKEGGRTWTNPAIFIEFEPLKYENMGNQIQEFELVFSVHLVNDCYYEGENRILETDLNHMQMLQDIYTTLQGAQLQDPSTPTEILLNPIARTSLTPDHALDSLIVTIQEFKATGIDRSAYRAKQIIAAPTTNVTFKIQ